jgi:hypothetical protein
MKSSANNALLSIGATGGLVGVGKVIGVIKLVPLAAWSLLAPASEVGRPGATRRNKALDPMALACMRLRRRKLRSTGQRRVGAYTNPIILNGGRYAR